jgi:hypothetical protein
VGVETFDVVDQNEESAVDAVRSIFFHELKSCEKDLIIRVFHSLIISTSVSSSSDEPMNLFSELRFICGDE